jgi:transcriptional regulator with AAA-type ATPase domain
MRDVVSLVARAAAGRAGVMICGEDGSGRHVVARAIHGARTEPGPFITADCAAFEAGALELMLFGSPGHVESEAAFEGQGNHGADIRELERIDQSCLLAQANGGTLYFQNVTDASSRVQARLARIFRDREAFVADSKRSVVLDVRPMAGVDLGVEESVRDGRFREDLFRRLSAVRIDVPPLRNRRDDIPALANQFVQDICAWLQTPIKTLTTAALVADGTTGVAAKTNISPVWTPTASSLIDVIVGVKPNLTVCWIWDNLGPVGVMQAVAQGPDTGVLVRPYALFRTRNTVSKQIDILKACVVSEENRTS